MFTPGELGVEVKELEEQAAGLQAIKIFADFSNHDSQGDTTEIPEVCRVQPPTHGPETDRS